MYQKRVGVHESRQTGSEAGAHEMEQQHRELCLNSFALASSMSIYRHDIDDGVFFDSARCA